METATVTISLSHSELRLLKSALVAKSDQYKEGTEQMERLDATFTKLAQAETSILKTIA